MSMVHRLAALVAALFVSLAPALAHDPGLNPTAATSVAAPATASPASKADAAAAAPGPTTTAAESIDNPYGLRALWRQGDYVAKGTIIALLGMSIGSWYIMLTKLFEQIAL